MKIEKFVWDDKYSVKIKTIDAQHKHFFEIANGIYDLLEKGATKKEELILRVTELGNYAMYHLSTEEKYFKEFNYDGAETHTQAHNAFRDKSQEYINRIIGAEASVENLADEIADFAKNWLSHHILGMDRLYVDCFVSHGLK